MEFIDLPTERTTAVTDVLLALLALAGLIYVLYLGQGDSWKARLWASAFGLLVLAASLGAVAHGFKMSEQTNQLIWHPLNLSLGLTVALFVVGVIYDTWGLVAARQALPLLIIVGIAFFGMTLLISGTFRVFILYQTAAMLFALVAYSWLALTGRLEGAGLMAAGILVFMIAAAVQVSEAVSLTLIWQFDHNGLYHLILMAGLLLLLAGLRAGLVSGPLAPPAG